MVSLNGYIYSGSDQQFMAELLRELEKLKAELTIRGGSK